MKYSIYYILILLLLTSQATALNDINISIDAGSYEICLTQYQTKNQTCNITEILTLDGGQDHYIEITPRKIYNSERNLKDWIISPINFFLDLVWSIFPFILILGGGISAIILLYLILRFIIDWIR